MFPCYFINSTSPDLWSDVWSAGTAIGTFSLAIATFWVILQNRSERAAVERHHRDGFKPICIIDQNRVPGRITAITMPENINVVIFYLIPGKLKNVGVGPGLKAEISLHIPRRSFESNIINSPLELLRPIVVGNEYTFMENSRGNRTVDIYQFTDRVFSQPDLILAQETILDINSEIYMALLNVDLQLEIIVSDVFGQRFRTRYVCVPTSQVIGDSFRSETHNNRVFEMHQILLSLDRVEELASSLS